MLIIVPSRVLLEQISLAFPKFGKVGTSYNRKISKRAPGYVAVSESVHLLQGSTFGAIFIDEAHHPPPHCMPKGRDVFAFSATHRNATDFEYNMGQAIHEGVLCDYDLTVPVITKGHAGATYACLASLLLRNHGRFRRVLAYCNTIAEAKRVRLAFEKCGIAAWHINGQTMRSKRQSVMQEFSGALQAPVHVLVTVQVLGEGVNIPHADTCMFVEPRNSYTVIVQAVGRILRQHACKPLAHIILPAMALTSRAPAHLNVAGLSAPACDGVDGFASLDTAATLPMSLAISHSFLGGSEVDAQAIQNPSTGFKRGGARASDFGSATLVANTSTTPSVQQAAPNPMLQLSRARHVGLKAAPHHDIAEHESGGYESPCLHSERVPAKLRPAQGAQLQKDEIPLSEGEKPHVQRPNATANDNSLLALLSGVATLATSTPVENKSARDSTQKALVSISSWAAASPAQEWQVEFKAPSQSLIENGMQRQSAERDGIEIFDIGDRLRSSSLSKVFPSAPDIDSSHASPLPNDRGKMTRFFGAWADDAHASQLERFLSVLAQADSRLVNPSQNALQARLCFVKCGALQDADLVAAIPGWFQKVLNCLREPDPWEARLAELEDFIKLHGRMPSYYYGKQEKCMYVWLKNVGYYIKKSGMAAAQRLSRLLASPSLLLRQRALKWQHPDPEKDFRRKCSELKDYIAKFGTLPLHSRKSDNVCGRRLAGWLRAQRASLQRHVYSTNREKFRARELRAIHFMVADFLDSPARPSPPVSRRRSMELQRFVTQACRLPSAYKGRLETKLYNWMTKQKHRMCVLSAQDQSRLLNLHPLVTSFLSGKVDQQFYVAT